MRTIRYAECACCGDYGPHHSWGWIDKCYRRWRDAGRPTDGPPAPKTNYATRRRPEYGRIAKLIPEKDEALEEFAMVLRTRAPITITRAAEAVGRCGRTGTRYMRELRAMGHPAVDYWERVRA